MRVVWFTLLFGAVNGSMLQCDYSGEPADLSRPSFAASKIVARVASKMDEFEEANVGMSMCIVDEEQGSKGGGASNPNGIYLNIGFSSEINPRGSCEIYKGGSGMEIFPFCIPTGNATTSSDKWAGIVDQQNFDSVTLNMVQGLKDVLAVVMCTPPNVKYFGFDTVISRRFDNVNAGPLEGNYWSPGINFADPVNHVNMKIDPYKDDPEPVAVLFAYDADAAAAASKAFDVVGMKTEVVKLDPSVLRPVHGDRNSDEWMSSRPDAHHPIIRASIFDSEDHDFGVFKNTTWGAVWFKGDESKKLNLFDTTPKKREIGVSEINAIGGARGWASFLQKVHANQASQGFIAKTMLGVNNYVSYAGLYDDWEMYLENWRITKAIGGFPAGTRDGTYGLPGSFHQWNVAHHKKQRVVIVGVNHALSPIQASYHSVGLNVMAPGTQFPADPVYSKWYDDELAGSAAFLDVDEVFFHREFSEDCLTNNPEFCEIVVESEWQESSILELVSRAYSSKVTGLGPSMDEIIEAVMIIFEEV